MSLRFITTGYFCSDISARPRPVDVEITCYRNSHHYTVHFRFRSITLSMPFGMLKNIARQARAAFAQHGKVEMSGQVNISSRSVSGSAISQSVNVVFNTSGENADMLSFDLDQNCHISINYNELESAIARDQGL